MSTADELRAEILALVERYYDEAFGGGEGAGAARALAAPGDRRLAVRAGAVARALRRSGVRT